MAAGGYFLLVPGEELYRLRHYDTAVVLKGDLAQITQASGTVTIPTTLSVLSPETGYAALLEVQEGEVVGEGRLLARLDVPDLEDELADLAADLRVKEQNLASSIEQDRFALQKLEQLVQINASRQSDLDAAKVELRALQRDKEQLELEIEENQALSVLSQASQRASIELDRTAIRRLEQRIAESSIESPMAHRKHWCPEPAWLESSRSASSRTFCICPGDRI